VYEAPRTEVLKDGATIENGDGEVILCYAYRIDESQIGLDPSSAPVILEFQLGKVNPGHSLFNQGAYALLSAG
jgi:hypothetical protein